MTANRLADPLIVSLGTFFFLLLDPDVTFGTCLVRSKLHTRCKINSPVRLD